MAGSLVPGDDSLPTACSLAWEEASPGIKFQRVAERGVRPNAKAVEGLLKDSLPGNNQPHVHQAVCCPLGVEFGMSDLERELDQESVRGDIIGLDGNGPASQPTGVMTTPADDVVEGVLAIDEQLCFQSAADFGQPAVAVDRKQP